MKAMTGQLMCIRSGSLPERAKQKLQIRMDGALMSINQCFEQLYVLIEKAAEIIRKNMEEEKMIAIGSDHGGVELKER